VIAQDQDIAVADVRDQPRPLVVLDGDAFVVVVADLSDEAHGFERHRQEAALQGRDGRAGDRVGVHDAMRVVAGLVDGAVNDPAGRVDRPAEFAAAGLDDLAVDRDLDEAGSGDLVVPQAEGIDEELPRRAGDAHRQVIEDQCRPAEMIDQPIGRRQLDAQLLLDRHRLRHIGQSHGVLPSAPFRPSRTARRNRPGFAPRGRARRR
jgi:hypothetical protein